MLAAAQERVDDCVSISAGLLVSHPAALEHQLWCHVAEQPAALMDESNLLPTQRALLLALQKVLRKVPLHSHVYSLYLFILKQIVFMFARLHTQALCVSKELSNLPAWNDRESLLIRQEQNPISSPDQLLNISPKLEAMTLLVMTAPLLLPLYSLRMLYAFPVLSLCSQGFPSIFLVRLMTRSSPGHRLTTC